ncbi:hypothetical protein KIN20_029104 [Parelaphostrongylus tenuis]|uniref:Calcium channel flower n=1 Tax=Parelaphostrongylus tenuis TaxID=148309 RepID=A0AAD5R264_PARTN|nr:hypothetical protein KIN20_029104 [Parelaphostrongylus tenuis]
MGAAASNVSTQMQAEHDPNANFPWWVRFLAKGVGIIGGFFAIFFGALGLLSLSAKCIIASLLQMVFGFLTIALEAPFCCMFVDFIEKIAQFKNIMVNYIYPFHDHFFIAYILMGSTILLLNLQMMLVIRRSKSLWIHSAYRLIFFACAADTVNCGTQVAVVALTLRTPAIHPRTNMLLGTLFQASYVAEYPTILVLAVNRFIAVIFPTKMDLIFNRRKTTVTLLLCCLFSALNISLFVTGEVYGVWNPSVPKFYFSNRSSFIAILARSTSLYFGEFVYIASFVTYLIIVVFLLFNVSATLQFSPRRASATVSLVSITL